MLLEPKKKSVRVISLPVIITKQSELIKRRTSSRPQFVGAKLYPYMSSFRNQGHSLENGLNKHSRGAQNLKNHFFPCSKAKKILLLDFIIEYLSLNFSGHFEVLHYYVTTEVTIWQGNFTFL